MTITYDPQDPAYWDETDLRGEMTRVFDLCHGCRMCFKLCPSFPSLFEMIDEFDDQDAARMTPAQQDRVVDECFNCKLCYVICPYIPGQSEWELDFPRLMLRAEQVRHRNQKQTIKAKLTTQALGRTDLAGKANTALAPLANKAIGTPGSASRKLMEKTVGIAAQRLLPPYARQRFSTWFTKRRDAGITTAPAPGAESRTETAVLFPTCIVEYQAPEVGHDLVKVCERNGVTCELPEGEVCCGAPWLHAGDVDRFVEQGRKNVEVLAEALRAGGPDATVVVPQPTCSYVLKKDYVDYLGGPDAELVASRTQDAAEYIMGLHKDEGGPPLDTEFAGEVPEAVTYHAPCHLRAQNIGLKSRDLLKLTGTKITVVSECSGIDGTWGYRQENFDASRQVAKKMANAIDKADNDAVAGDCHLANGAIVQETGKRPSHPVQFLARAYAIPEEGTP